MTEDIKLTLLGTGTPTPSHRRAGSSYLLECGDRVLLFDCGPACVRRLLEGGFDLRRITDLFLTHLHYDHCLDYARLMLTHWDQGAGKIGVRIGSGKLAPGQSTCPVGELSG